MKKLLLILVLLPLLSIGQNPSLKEYTASNGITYKSGDEIKLGRGSNPNGKFVYVTIGGMAASSRAENNQLPANNSGLVTKLKKIRMVKRTRTILFIVGGGNIANYYMDIENAIATCEVEDCKDVNDAVVVDDKYEKLSRLKELFDEGVLTEEEFQAEKKKILEQ